MDNKSIQENVLKTLLYYHIFKHPLTLDEIYTFYPETGITKLRIKEALYSLISSNGNLIGEHDGYYFISPNQGYVGERLKKEKISDKSWKIARIMTLIIKAFPFVRGIFVTGSLSKNSSDENSDIDFLIICKENRLWIVRTIIRLFIRIFLLNDNKYLCANYFLAENNLSINDRNVFTATELAHVKVMYNTKILNDLMQKNNWIEQYFPNYFNENSKYHFSNYQTSDRASAIQSLFEIFFTGEIGNRAEYFLQQNIIKHLQNKFPDCTDNSFDLSINSAKTHGIIRDNKKYVLDKCDDLFRQYKHFYHT